MSWAEIKYLQDKTKEQNYDMWYNIFQTYVASYGDNQESILVIPYGTENISSLSHKNFEQVVIPRTAKTILPNAFMSAQNMVSVTLPPSLETIGSGAFINCSSMNYIKIPLSVKTIGSGAFGNCLNLKDIYLESSEGEIEGAPWGAPAEVVLHYDWDLI